jgi:outer membrane protein insertion porin family
VTDPYFLDTKWTLGADIYRSEREYIDYSRRLLGGDIKTGYPLNDFVGIFFMYKYEIKDIYNPSVAYQLLNWQDKDNYPSGNTVTSSIFGSITRNVTDYRLDPSSGMINTFAIDFAGVGGDNKFARFTTDHNWFYPLYKKLIFSTKLSLGYVQEVGKPIPIDEKFYLGGIYSLRGYRARTVAPYKQHISKEINGNQSKDAVYLGGDKEFNGSTEITVPILPDAGVKGVLFFDYGNSFKDFNTIFKTKLTNFSAGSSLLMSYGGGIRWASPLGPLRLEYGIPINPRGEIDSKSGRFEFSMGSLF